MCSLEQSIEADLVFISEVILELLLVFCIVVTQSTLIWFGLIVFVDVLLQTVATRTCERALMTAEDQTVQVTRQFRARHFQRDHSLFWGEKERNDQYYSVEDSG